MPNPLWSKAAPLPPSPPPKRMLNPHFAAEIAGKLGYCKGVPVLVLVEGKWCTGKVEHISTALCPGALQVRYDVGENHNTVLICPWNFPTMLRPFQQEPPNGERSRVTLEADESDHLEKQPRRSVRTRGSRKSKSPPEVRQQRCNPPNCCVQ